MQNKLDEYIDCITQVAGKDPVDDNYIRGVIAALRDVLNFQVEGDI